MTLHIISDALQQRVTAHLNQVGTLARSVLWTGRGSIVVHFTEPMNVTATDQRFAPLSVNWSATFRAPDGAIHFNVPAAWRKEDRETGEGEANVTAKLTPLMDELLHFLADGFVAIEGRCEAVFGDRKYGFAANSLTGLIKRGLVDKVGDMERYVINAAGRAAINRPIADPTAPIPANEIENLDEPHSDIGTLVSDEAPLTVSDQAIVNAPEAPAEEYVYISLARPAWRGETVPSEGFIRSFEARHPVWSGAECAVYSRKLGRAELERYELRPYSYNAYEFAVGQRVLWLENDDVYEVTGRDDGRYHLRHECGDVQRYIPEIKLATAIERGAPVMTVIIEATGKEGERLHPAPCGYPEYLCSCGIGGDDNADPSPEPMQPADPTAWATDAKRAEVSAFLEAKNFYPAELKPTSVPGVWLVEDYRRAEKFKARLEKLGVEIVGKVISDWMGDEPYAVAEIRLPEGALESVSEDYRPFPSGRRTKPAPAPNSLYAQYDALHESLPAAALLLIQANAENWNAYTIDAALLRRYAPLCRFAAQVVNERGEKWDGLTVPAGVVDELLDLANEGGLTVALAPIVRDEPSALPAREVTEIRAPGEPVQYVGQEEAPEADEDEITNKTLADYPTLALSILARRETVLALWSHYQADLVAADPKLSPIRAGEIAAAILCIDYEDEQMQLAKDAGCGNASVDALFNGLDTWEYGRLKDLLIDLSGTRTLTLDRDDYAPEYRPLVRALRERLTPTDYRLHRYADRVRAGMCRVTLNGVEVEHVTRDMLNGAWFVHLKDVDRPLETDDLPVLVVTPLMSASTHDPEPEPIIEVAAPPAPKLDMTPERVAAKIRMRIEGGLRLGRVCAVTPDRLLDGTFVVRFMHPVNAFALKALNDAYDETHAVDEDRFCVSLRPKSAAAHGDVLDQAAAVIATTPALPDAPALLSEINELHLMDELRFDYPALYEAAPGVVSFLLNVIAALRAERLASVVEHS